MWRATVTEDGLDVDIMLSRMDTAAREVLQDEMAQAAELARQDHAYTTRTGALEGSTQALPVTGSFSAGTLESGVEASMEYAEPVVARTGDDFVTRAVESRLPSLEDRLGDALAQAANG